MLIYQEKNFTLNIVPGEFMFLFYLNITLKMIAEFWHLLIKKSKKRALFREKVILGRKNPGNNLNPPLVPDPVFLTQLCVLSVDSRRLPD